MPEQPIYYDSHMHTPLCKHAIGDPTEYAEHGRARGLKGIIITCHSPMPDGFSHAVRMAPKEFDRYVQLVDDAATQMAGSLFEVKLGLESDWFPGMEPWLEKLHARAAFHYILGSVHYHVPEYRARFWKNDPLSFQIGYFEHLAEAAESGLFDSISHPDLVKNDFPDTWSFEAVAHAVDASLERISRSGVAMELNTSGLNKTIREMNPGLPMLRMMAEKNIPVVVGSDSHHPRRVGDRFEDALQTLRKAGYEEVSYFHNRQRHSLPIADALQSLRTP